MYFVHDSAGSSACPRGLWHGPALKHAFIDEQACMQLQEQWAFAANRGGYWRRATGIGVVGALGYRAFRRRVDRAAWGVESRETTSAGYAGRECDWERTGWSEKVFAFLSQVLWREDSG